MSVLSVVHDTFAIEKTFGLTPEEVFAAFAEPARKRIWFATSPSFETLEYAKDFSVGGQEVLVGKMAGGTPIAGALLRWTSQHDDIRQDARIVFSQRLDLNERCISCALVTVEFLPAAPGCRLLLTHQAAFFEGSDGPEMRKAGWLALLESLGISLSPQ